MEENKFGHDQSLYERPNLPYRCGRASLWQKPCNNGPELDGTCGGIKECTPFLKNDRWECRREKRFGGTCENGPGPYGDCSIQRPPCAPRSTFRVIRGRLVMFAVAVVLVLIGSSLALDRNAVGWISFTDAGPLSKSHANFTEEGECSFCHEAHSKGPVGWIKAVFSYSDLSKKCVDCHNFGGPSFMAHNANLSQGKKNQTTQCIMCHREHNGPSMNTVNLTSVQCSSCHNIKIESLENRHPEFSKQYPYFLRNSIKFDHSSHLKKHFENPKVSDKAPSSCLGCHMISLADREVRPDSYKMICAACHDSQIKKKELVFLRLPELIQNRIDRESLVQTCNMPEGQAKMEEEFLSVSTEQPALINAYLLKIQADDPEAYDEPLQDLIFAMAEDTSIPFVDLIDGRTEVPMSGKLLSGLNPEVIKRAACSWGLNLEYEPPAAAKFGGWYADMLEVRYKPVSHADPVAKSWVEFALTVSSRAGNEDATEMVELILSAKEGVGGCIKCHAVKQVKGEKGTQLTVNWNYSENNYLPYVRYKHDGHIEIMGRKSSCSNCHFLNKDAEFLDSYKNYNSENWVSNFKPIRKKTCMQCHSETQIDLECQKCHSYHFKPGFKKDMLTVRTELSPADLVKVQ